MSKSLVIVESSGKIESIKKILGSGYVVAASGGHVMDLESNNMSIDIKNDFEPIYKITQRGGDTIKKLKSLKKNVKEVLLATDKDREGEMIAWNIAQALNLKSPKRLLFTSITKSELLNAIKNPKQIDMNMIDAQKTRRILDRIVGFEISPILWKSSCAKSAGRVQSVIIKMIVEKESIVSDYFSNSHNSFFRVKASFNLNGNSISSILYSKSDSNSKSDSDNDSNDSVNSNSVKMTLSDCNSFLILCMSSVFSISNISSSESYMNPPPPYTTSTMQQDTSKKLHFNSKKTMLVAQHLYEEGLITYMRTDSVNLSKEALEDLQKFIIEHYGNKYYFPHKYNSKGDHTQDAHEAIRPTYISKLPSELIESGKISNDEIKLYSLIWTRTIASQMAKAKYNIMTLQIAINKSVKYMFVTQIKKLIFEGFLLIYGQECDKDKSPSVVNGTILTVENIIGNEDYAKPIPRYSEASLLAKLEKMEIGRPATTASIISKIQENEYVSISNIDGIKKDCKSLIWDGKTKNIIEKKTQMIIGKETKKFVPTQLGITVTNFMNTHFPNIMEYKFTADMECTLDKIANGVLNWKSELHKFYNSFHPSVVKLNNALPVPKNINDRLLGKHPETQGELYASITKYGHVVKYHISTGKPLYENIKLPLNADNITLDDALKLFTLPKQLGLYENEQIILKSGRYGLYLTFGSSNYPINDKDITENDVDLEYAINIIVSKKPKKEFKEGNTIYTILNGQYGHYIRIKTNNKISNVSIQKNIDIEKLDISDIKNIIKNYKNYIKNNKKKSTK